MRREPYRANKDIIAVLRVCVARLFTLYRERQLMEKLNLYYIDLKYIRNLSNADDNVMSISPQRGKENRPFVGVITNRAQKVYDLVVNKPDKNKNLTKRSSKFKALEKELDKLLNRI